MSSAFSLQLFAFALSSYLRGGLVEAWSVRFLYTVYKRFSLMSIKPNYVELRSMRGMAEKRIDVLDECQQALKVWKFVAGWLSFESTPCTCFFGTIIACCLLPGLAKFARLKMWPAG